MKRHFFTVALAATTVLTVAFAYAQDQPGAAEAAKPVVYPADLQDLETRASYAIGLDMGKRFKELPVKINIDQLLAGVNAGLAGEGEKLNDEQLQATFAEFGEEMEKRLTEQKTAEGKKFLDENAKKEGVKVTESGLQYKVIKEGEGASPKATDEVTVHYEGKLTNGEVFDSSFKRGQPISFPLNGVIKGWTEGVQLMKKGAKYEFVIPSHLAYGERGRAPVIGPNETLVFQVELIEFKAAAAAP